MQRNLGLILQKRQLPQLLLTSKGVEDIKYPARLGHLFGKIGPGK